MKIIRHIGSLAFVLGLFVVVFAGVPWHVLVAEAPVVMFFIDPLHPHPHIEDIRVVFGACMIQDQVRMLTNEMQGREWMERVVKRGT